MNIVMVIDWDNDEVNDNPYNEEMSDDGSEENKKTSFTSEPVEEISSLPTFQSDTSFSVNTPSTSTTPVVNSNHSGILNNHIVPEDDFSFIDELGGFTSSAPTTGIILFYSFTLIVFMIFTLSC